MLNVFPLIFLFESSSMLSASIFKSTFKILSKFWKYVFFLKFNVLINSRLLHRFQWNTEISKLKKKTCISLHEIKTFISLCDVIVPNVFTIDNVTKCLTIKSRVLFWNVLIVPIKEYYLCNKEYKYCCISNVKNKSLVVEWYFTRALTCIHEILLCTVNYDLFFDIWNARVGYTKIIFVSFIYFCSGNCLDINTIYYL